MFVYSRMLGYLLIIPVFATTCAGIGSQVTATTNFIRSCIVNNERKVLNLHLIKMAYAKIADSILMANHLFSLFIPLVIIVFGFGGMLNDVISLNATAASKVVMAWFMVNVAPSVSQAFGKGNKTGPFDMGIMFPGINRSGNMSFANATINLEEISEGSGANESSNSIFDLSDVVRQAAQLPPIPPQEVRYLVGITFQTLLYGLVIFLAIMEALRTNDKVRYLQVWLNDFASESHVRTGKSFGLACCVSTVGTNKGENKAEQEDFAREVSHL